MRKKKIQPEIKVKVFNLRKKREKKSQHQLYVPLTHHKEHHYIVITLAAYSCEGRLLTITVLYTEAPGNLSSFEGIKNIFLWTRDT